MPRPSKKSLARRKAYQNARKDESKNESNDTKFNTLIQHEQREIRVEYLKRLLGNFHQGHSMFNKDSRGLQCSCNSLVMLCRIPDIMIQLDKKHLDQILIDGDYLYRMTVQYLNNSGEMQGFDCLETTQLPNLVALLDRSMYEINYKPLIYCILEQEVNNDLRSLYEELQVAFTTANSIILVMGGYMMAVYRDLATGHYVFFDSHSRDEFGFPSPSGTSVILIFEDFDNLLIYLNILCHKLNISSQIFGIQPLEITSTNQPHSKTEHTCSNSRADELNNEPGCSSSSYSSDITKTSNVPSRRLSRYQKWYQMLSDTERTRLLERKRKTSSEVYGIQEVAEHKKLQARQQYAIPEKAAKKKQQSRESYAIPEKAAKKQQQSRESYAIPEKAAKKQQQSRESYAIPEKAAKKQQQSRESYAIPAQAEKKKTTGPAEIQRIVCKSYICCKET